MAGCGGIHTGKQHFFKILYAYLAFVTRYRHEVFAARHLERMEEITRDLCADFGAELREFSGDTGHVHLLVNFPPTVTSSRLASSLISVSSRRLRREFPDLRSNTSGCSARGRARASPTPWQALPSLSCAGTSSSRTGRPGRGRL